MHPEKERTKVGGLMRRPKFSRWIRLELMKLGGLSRFSLRKLAAQAQRENSLELRAALALYAHENNCITRLKMLVYDEEYLKEIHEIERHFGARSAERLALRGTPMMSLPAAYRHIMASYEDAYYTPERITAEKVLLRERTRKAVLLTGTSPAEIARALELDIANMNAYLTRGETHRFTLETARAIAEFAA